MDYKIDFSNLEITLILIDECYLLITVNINSGTEVGRKGGENITEREEGVMRRRMTGE